MERYKKDEVLTEVFIQVPKALFLCEEYRDLSANAILMYGVLRDRMQLSKKNEWVNEDDEVFFIFGQREMEEFLHISHATCSKTMKELEQHELIDRVRMGLGKADHIFLGKIKPGEETSGSINNELQTSKNYTSDVQKINSNDTEVSYLKKDEDEDEYGNHPQPSSSSSSSSAISFFEKNGHKLVPFERKNLKELIEKYGDETVVKAMQEAVLKNALNVKYVSIILKNWDAHGGDHNPKHQSSTQRKIEYWTPEKHARDIEKMHLDLEKYGIPVNASVAPSAESKPNQKESEQDHRPNFSHVPGAVAKTESNFTVDDADVVADTQLKSWEAQNGALPLAVRNPIIRYMRQFGADSVFAELKNHPLRKGDNVAEILIGMGSRLSANLPKIEAAG